MSVLWLLGNALACSSPGFRELRSDAGARGQKILWDAGCWTPVMTGLT